MLTGVPSLLVVLDATLPCLYGVFFEGFGGGDEAGDVGRGDRIVGAEFGDVVGNLIGADAVEIAGGAPFRFDMRMHERENALNIGFEFGQGFQAVPKVHRPACEIADLGLIGGPSVQQQFTLTVGRDGALPILDINGEDTGRADDQVIDIAVAVRKIEVADHGIGVGQVFQVFDEVAFSVSALLFDAGKSELLVEKFFQALEPRNRNGDGNDEQDRSP